jgi:hypothetical protein
MKYLTGPSVYAFCSEASPRNEAALARLVVRAGVNLALVDAIAQVWTKMIVWTFSLQGVAWR